MFSVIIPTYNRENLLPKAVQSVFNQTCPDWELIIIDDGSTDRTKERLEKYLEDPRVQYVWKENSGGAESRNIGVSLAKHEFIVFLDSDDEAYADWLETAASFISEETGIICAGANRKFQDGTVLKEPPYPVSVYGEQMDVKFTAGSLFVRRSIFLEAGGYSLDMPSGLHSELGYTLLAHLHYRNLRIASIEKSLVQINIHGGPRMRTQWNTLTIDCLQFVKKFYPYLRKWDRKELSNNFAVVAFYHYKAGKRKASLYYLLKAIRFRPQRVSNYMRLVRYSVL